MPADATLWTELDRLRRLRAGQMGPGAMGGARALSGFSFQLAASLLMLVRSQASSRHSQVLLEYLSDLVAMEGGYVIVTQAKLTLGSGAIRDALNELWQIDALAKAETPDLAPHLRYIVLTSRSAVRDVDAALARWRPDSESDAAGAFRDRVTVRVEANPLQSLATHLVNAFGDSTPFDTAHQWLGTLFSRPTPEGFEESCGNVLTKLAALEEAARERAHRFHIWTDGDQAPTEPRYEGDPAKATLVGQIPHRSHLVEGRFARRTIYGRIHKEAEDWLRRAGIATDGRIPAFWLSGRSGTGKSVALLHLLADLRLEDPSRTIIWLDDQGDRLAEAVRWARPFFSANRQIILAADDPYTPERYQRMAGAIADAGREWDSVSIAHPDAVPPVLIFCGPTEQAQAFEDDLVDRVVIKPHPLPVETQDDIRELREWYQRRTGKTDLPVGEVENVLLVQIFFEWSTGQPINEFALRFRRRLKGMMPAARSRNVFHLVAEILALNRLYALFPAQTAQTELESDAELGTAFDRLSGAERHFSFDAGGGGYRLTHPHLANAIYTAWFGRGNDQRHRKGHLRSGIQAALNSNGTPSQRFAPLWAISRLTSKHGRPGVDLGNRLELIKLELPELLVEIYNHLFAASANPLTELPVWADLDVALELALVPSPLGLLATTARDAAESSPGLRLTCHKLLQHRDRLPVGAEVVAKILRTFLGWSEWERVATNYLSTVGVSGIEDELSERIGSTNRASARRIVGSCARLREPAMRETIVSWLEAFPVGPDDWSDVFTDFLDNYGICEKSRQLAWNHLRLFQNDPSWSHVWDRLYALVPRDRHALESLARGWLKSADPEISGWDRIWEELWKSATRNDSDLRSVGAYWLDDVPAHRSWAYIWREMWRGGQSPADDWARVRRWLDTQFDHPSWTYLWPEIFAIARQPSSSITKFCDSDEEVEHLRLLALSWLDQCRDHPSWTFVWEDLWLASSGADEQARAYGDQWIEDCPAHASWSYIWDKLRTRTSGHGGEVYLARGRRWLDRATDLHPAWRYVWNQLWENSNRTDAELLARARRWLREAWHSKSWPQVWTSLWEAAGGADDELFALAQRRWADADLDHSDSTQSLDGHLALSGRIDNAFRSLGRAWLEEAPPNHQSWGNVWRSLWQAPDLDAPARANMVAQALAWLSVEGLSSHNWRPVWEVLWNETVAESDLLTRLAEIHLRQSPLEDAQGIRDRFLRGRALSPPGDAWAWKDDWQRQWINAAGDPTLQSELTYKAQIWLAVFDLDQRGWTSVWRYLWSATSNGDPIRPNLVELAHEWLMRSASPNRRWGEIWLTIWHAHDEADARRRALLVRRAHEWMVLPGTEAHWTPVWWALWNAADQRSEALAAVARSRYGTLDVADRELIEALFADPAGWPGDSA